MAFRIAVSGIQAATADLDVTGNNIANANTTGFKSSRAEFADVYAASNLGTSKDAIGAGVALSRVAQQFTQGNVSFTENSLDLAINGEGFFTVEDSEGRFYTRAGAFSLDKDGNVVNATGQRLLGFQASAGQVTGAIGPLTIRTTNLAPQASQQLSVQVNLDAADPVPASAFDPSDPGSYNNSTSLTIFDSLGEEHLGTVYFRKTGANQWNSYLTVDSTQVGANVAVTFGSDGALQSPTSPQSFGSFTPSTGAAAMPLTIDLSGTTQFGADFGVNALGQDGYTTGRLSGIDIDSQGVVLARFSNGKTAPQGQVMLANFGNPQGLRPNGDTLWTESSESGPPLAGAPGTAALGLVQSGALEESNVDLAGQFVQMIMTQRGFQANSRSITTTDQMMEEVINLKR